MRLRPLLAWCSQQLMLSATHSCIYTITATHTSGKASYSGSELREKINAVVCTCSLQHAVFKSHDLLGSALGKQAFSLTLLPRTFYDKIFLPRASSRHLPYPNVR